MTKETKLERVTGLFKNEEGSSAVVYYTGEGYSENIDDAKIFQNGGRWTNSVGDAIYRMKETYHLNGIVIEEI